MSEKIKLTQFSHGAGCGCKISPQVLNQILGKHKSTLIYPDLLVGNDTRDDAAVYDLDGETAIISTTDFFTPIVDDPFDFGAIASVNAISDVYAMGGKPLMAVAILGWPVDKIPAKEASKVLDGARDACFRAGIPLAGGHSIDSPEPIFGLAVTGSVKKKMMLTNSRAKAGSDLYLTKPLGVGIMTTAQKKGVLFERDFNTVRESMLKLNDLGKDLGKIEGVNALTDVTGFGLLGHLIEMCEGSNLSAQINFKNVPLLPGLEKYINQGTIPGGTNRNFNSYGFKANPLTPTQKKILCDPQTSGGLLISITPGSKIFQNLNYDQLKHLRPIGRLVHKTDLLVSVV